MPPRTFATDRVLISAVMEPAYEVSGDVFDYAIADETVHLALFDAMGHDTAAGLTANLARRRQPQPAPAEPRPPGHRRGRGTSPGGAFGANRYATGILAELDSTTGVLTWTSLGHPPPVIIRKGRTALSLPARPPRPWAPTWACRHVLHRDQLEPGDRLLLYTDGITEARNSEGQEFGLAGFTDFLIQHHADGLPVPETLRRLIRRHLAYHDGRLGDDATRPAAGMERPHPLPPRPRRSPRRPPGAHHRRHRHALPLDRARQRYRPLRTPGPRVPGRDRRFPSSAGGQRSAPPTTGQKRSGGHACHRLLRYPGSDDAQLTVPHAARRYGPRHAVASRPAA